MCAEFGLNVRPVRLEALSAIYPLVKPKVNLCREPNALGEPVQGLANDDRMATVRRGCAADKVSSTVNFLYFGITKRWRTEGLGKGIAREVGTYDFDGQFHLDCCVLHTGLRGFYLKNIS
jgi:hypothetical protein